MARIRALEATRPGDAVFATTGISPHEVPKTVPNASPLDSNDDADERATLEAHALELGSQLRATGGHLDALSAMSAESLAEILGMRGGVEAELDALRRERRRLETLTELESLKRSLAAVAEGREDQNIDPDETRARVAALVASLASLDDDDDGDAAASGLADSDHEAFLRERRSATETRATRSLPQTTRRKLGR